MNYGETFPLALFVGLTFVEPEHLKKYTKCSNNKEMIAGKFMPSINENSIFFYGERALKRI